MFSMAVEIEDCVRSERQNLSQSKPTVAVPTSLLYAMPLMDLVSWKFEDDFETAGANARIALALLRCARQVPIAWHVGAADELAWHLRPALSRLDSAMHRALSSLSTQRRAGAQVQDASSSTLLATRSGRTFIGLALLNEDPAFQALFDDTESEFERFIASRPHPLDHTVRLLTRVFDLSGAEARYLALAGSFSFGSLAPSVFIPLGPGSSCTRILSAMLGCSDREAAQLLNPSCALWRSGLLMRPIFEGEPVRMEDLFWLSPSGERLITLPGSDDASLAHCVLEPMQEPGWEGRTWPHLEDRLNLLQAVLCGGKGHTGPSLQILIHGPVGNGKGQFVKALLARSGLRGYRVPVHSPTGSEPSRFQRLANLELVRRFAAHQPDAVVILDGAQDLLSTQQLDAPCKAWMKHALTQTSPPVIWITDDVQCIDPAYLPRFTCCIEIPNPPVPVRRAWSQQALHQHGCSSLAIERFASHAATTTALLHGATRILSLCSGGELDADTVLEAFQRGHLLSQGHIVPAASPLRSSHGFDLRYLHLLGSMDVPGLVDSLASQGEGTVLLSGPSGAGKTSLAGELARRLGRSVVRVMASDFSSPFRGESARRLQAWFRMQDARYSVLLMDDLDALVGPGAEPGLVIALAHAMDAFEGVLVGTTSDPSQLPPLLQHRWTFRLSLQPLTLVQRCGLFDHLVPPSMGPDPGEIRSALEPLDRLTPGDFYNVQARLRHQHADGRRWLFELAHEHHAQTPARA